MSRFTDRHVADRNASNCRSSESRTPAPSARSDASSSRVEHTDPFDLGRLHQRLRMLRGGRSIRELADVTDHHPETVRRYLTCSPPSVVFLRALADEYEVRLDWLISGEGPMQRSQATQWRLREAPLDLLLHTAVSRLLERLENGDAPSARSKT